MGVALRLCGAMAAKHHADGKEEGEVDRDPGDDDDDGLCRAHPTSALHSHCTSRSCCSSAPRGKLPEKRSGIVTNTSLESPFDT